jgi:tryptophan synthase alpha chain
VSGNLTDNRLVRAFADARRAGRKLLLPFITAGYPDLETTAALLADFERRGVRVCELGVPFSDPIADGPVIQASYTQALRQGIHSDGIFEMVRRRAAGGKMALVAMVSYSIVFRHGLQEYVRQAAEAGLDGLIIPDLPLEEAAPVEQAAGAAGLANVMLIAPTTPPARQEQIARHSRGFLYYISVAGTTGQRDALPPETLEAVARLRAHTDVPICVGFGISNAATVAAVIQAADGAIVGSAIVKRIAEAMDRDPERPALVAEVGTLVDELMAPCLNLERQRP